MEVVSVYTVTEYGTDKQYTEFVDGSGQDAINTVRKTYPRWTKFVLEGFEINGIFKSVEIW